MIAFRVLRVFHLANRQQKVRKMSFTQFDDVVPPGVTNLRMGSPAIKTLKKSVLIMKNAAELKLVDMINPYHYVTVHGITSLDLYTLNLKPS